MIRRLACFAAGALLLSGCILHQNRYREPNVFDPTRGVTAAECSVPVEFSGFINKSGSGVTFRYCDTVSVHQDEYSRWCLEPAVLVERAYLSALDASVTTGKPAVVSGELLKFEFDIGSKKAIFEARFIVEYAGKTRSFRQKYSGELTDLESKTAAFAMQRILSQGAVDFRKQLIEIAR